MNTLTTPATTLLLVQNLFLLQDLHSVGLRGLLRYASWPILMHHLLKVWTRDSELRVDQQVVPVHYVHVLVHSASTGGLGESD